MKVLVTGSSNGIGFETVLKFLNAGHDVIGIDLEESKFDNIHYKHYVCDIKDKDKLPEISDVEILINNAGLQNSENDIENNLVGTINVTEKYAFQPSIKSVLFNASASAHTGFEFAYYSASKAGMIGYMKHCAWRLAKEYKATCNSISCGGVITKLNDAVMSDKELWDQIMDVTPMKKWATAEEVAEWIYFMTIVNKSCTGQDVLIDNGEMHCNSTFIWPDFN